MTCTSFQRSPSPKVARISCYHIPPREFSEIQDSVPHDFQSDLLIGRWDVCIKLDAVQDTEVSDDFMNCVNKFNDLGYEYLILDPLGPVDASLKLFAVEGN